MKVLEEFWYGNINPMERPFQSQRKFDKVFRLLTKNEEEYIKILRKCINEDFDYTIQLYGTNPKYGTKKHSGIFID